jgi:uncharacterized coiled-coil DUF342 family protein
MTDLHTELIALRAELEKIRRGGEPNAYEARMDAYGKRIDELLSELGKAREEVGGLLVEHERLTHELIACRNERDAAIAALKGNREAYILRDMSESDEADEDWLASHALDGDALKGRAND